MELNEVFNEFITNEEFLKEYSHEEIMKGTYLEAGRDEGRDENQRETVMNMYNKNYPLKEIMDITKLSLNEVNAIIKDSKDN